jgi:hypothetical protein
MVVGIHQPRGQWWQRAPECPGEGGRYAMVHVWSPQGGPAAREGCSTFFHHEHAPVARNGCASGRQPDIAAVFHRARAGTGVARRGRASEKTSSAPSRGVPHTVESAAGTRSTRSAGNRDRSRVRIARQDLPFINADDGLSDPPGRLRAEPGMGVTRR